MSNPHPPQPVVCIGEILIDLIAHPGETLATAESFAIREGGAPMNAAIALSRLGVPARFCGVVGNDQFGIRLRSLLEREQVDVSSLRSNDDYSTSLAYAWRDVRGDGHFQLLRLADRLLDEHDVAAAGIPGAGALLAGSVALAASPSREAILAAVSEAVAHNVPVVFDVNVRPTLWPDLAHLRAACEPILQAARVLKLSLDDAHHLWGVETAEAAIARARVYQPWLIVVTDGARGVLVADTTLGEIRHHDVIPVEAVDPTGAGDAFTAAMLSRLLRAGWTRITDEDIRFAMAAGALATTRQGALPALPNLDELERFLAART